MVFPVKPDGETIEASLECPVDLGSGDANFLCGPFVDIGPDDFSSVAPVVLDGYSVACFVKDPSYLEGNCSKHIGIRSAEPRVYQTLGSRTELEAVGLRGSLRIVLIEVGLDSLENIGDGSWIVYFY